MGGRLSRTWSVVRREAPRKPDPLPSVPASVNSDIPEDMGPLEHRDAALEAQLRQLGDIITSEDAVFVPGSDPISAEIKRKERREWRRQMAKNRLTTAQFKDVLIAQDAAKGGAFVERLAEKYDVDAVLLRRALGYYRFPKIAKRYDGYLVTERWGD